MTYNITLESDMSQPGYWKASSHDCTDLGECSSLKSAIELARDKALDFSEYSGTQVVNVYRAPANDNEASTWVYTIGCGKRRGRGIKHV